MTTTDGDRVLRCITAKLDTSSNLEEINKNTNIKIMAQRGVQQ